MLGQIIEARIDEQLHGRGRNMLCEKPIPLLVLRFADCEDDLVYRAPAAFHEMWHGQFDDAPDAAGTEVIVDDDQLHSAGAGENNNAFARRFIASSFPILCTVFIRANSVASVTTKQPFAPRGPNTSIVCFNFLRIVAL